MICHWRSIHSEVTEVVQSVTNALLCLWKLIQATLTASLERSLFNVPLCYQQFGWWKHLFLNVFLALFCLKFSLFSLPVLSCRQIVSIRQSAINIPSIEMSTQPKSSDLQGSCHLYLPWNPKCRYRCPADCCMSKTFTVIYLRHNMLFLFECEQVLSSFEWIICVCRSKYFF